GIADGRKDALPTPALKLPGSDKKLLAEYQKIHGRFTKRFCSRGEDQQYDRLLRIYRGNGHYVHKLSDAQIDFDAIRAHLPLLKKKYRWIGKQRLEVSRLKAFPHYRRTTAPVRRRVDGLLKLKKAHLLATGAKRRERLRRESASMLRELEKDFAALTREVPFLLGFEFPVDHFRNRREYERVKDEESLQKKKQANLIFFLRKIHED